MANKDSQYYCAMCRKEVPLLDDGYRHNFVEVGAIEWNPDRGWRGLSSRERMCFSLCPKCYRKYEDKMRELINLKPKEVEYEPLVRCPGAEGEELSAPAED